MANTYKTSMTFLAVSFITLIFSSFVSAYSQNSQNSGTVVAQLNQSGQLSYENRIKAKINNWVVGLAAGKLEGAPIRFAEELSRVVDDGHNMHVLPIITRGPLYNVNALLYLRGVDLAILNADVMDYYKKQGTVKNIEKRINYITQLFYSELHILARPEINSIEDLNGRAVNFNTKGTSASFSGPAMLERLGIKVKEMFIPHPVAMQKMKKGDEIAAVVFVTAKPVRPLVKKKWPQGFKLLSANFNDRLSDYYLPARFSSKDYPEFIAEGQFVQTVAVPTVLAAYNWKWGSQRYRRVERFVQYMLKKWDVLRKPPYDRKWRNINLRADVPGWTRLPTFDAQMKTQQSGGRSGSNNQAKLQREFQRFLQAYQKSTGTKSFTEQQRKEMFKEFYKFWKKSQR